MSNQFTKYPTETYPIGVDYKGKAPTGAALISATWAATDMSDLSDVTATIFLSPAASVSGMIAKVRVRNGTMDHQYRLGVTATFDTGDILHDNVYMLVAEEG